MSRKKIRKLPVFLAIVVIIIVAFGVMVKWNSGYSENVSGNLNAFNSLKNAVLYGGNVELTSDDINSLFANYLKEPVKRGPITIKNIYTGFKNNEAEVKIPISYKNINFLVSSQGKVSLNDNYIIYTPDYFKVGLITVPKSLVLNKLKAANNDKLKVENGSLCISTSQLPVKINSFAIKSGKLVVGVDKLKINLNNSNLADIREKLVNAAENLNANEKSEVENVIKYIDNNPNSQNIVQDVKNKLGNVSSTEVKNIVNQINSQQNNNAGGSNQNQSGSGTKKVDSALASKVSGQLAAAAGSLSDGGARAVISEMQSQLASGNINSGAVVAQYRALSQYQKLLVQAAIAKNVNMQEAEELKSQFGI
ncbi:hypothetical protein [Clostridium hydrogenum]|uniref:hypothetical protein n=1 Tax=Clostridium hydrogenum TaxID=2855764 RepID=UPI001F39A949|nr:hypothetical protein [Clostridium hydrogenum]